MVNKTAIIRRLSGLIIVILILTRLGCEKQKEEAMQKILSEKDLYPESESQFVFESIDDSLAALLSTFLREDYLKNELPFLTKNDRKYQLYKVDLNHDKKEEYFVRFISPFFCRDGGCSILLLSQDFKVITRFTEIRPPLYLSYYSTNGWLDIFIRGKGNLKKMIFNGLTYPSNPNILPLAGRAPDNFACNIFDDINSKCKAYMF
ncbi:MAG: hypothetical protein K9I69_09350 [Ignavibacteriales bacterium]|nr:hypothetical protein [Ignavibacteriales bacterium]MCF8306898.1 hypothetical protein [Ignavibacteriales bacterium]MCF8438156.1 hypothetical protein [Ignavibacteriales bacterium]